MLNKLIFHAFEQKLIDLGYDDFLNDSVLTTSLLSINSLNLGAIGVEDLTGIEDFLYLEDLNLDYNNLQEVDVSQNIYLQHLNIVSNNPFFRYNSKYIFINFRC